jgi:hypothetical protein
LFSRCVAFPVRWVFPLSCVLVTLRSCCVALLSLYVSSAPLKRIATHIASHTGTACRKSHCGARSYIASQDALQNSIGGTSQRSRRKIALKILCSHSWIASEGSHPGITSRRSHPLVALQGGTAVRASHREGRGRNSHSKGFMPRRHRKLAAEIRIAKAPSLGCIPALAPVGRVGKD